MGDPGVEGMPDAGGVPPEMAGDAALAGPEDPTPQANQDMEQPANPYLQQQQPPQFFKKYMSRGGKDKAKAKPRYKYKPPFMMIDMEG